MPAIIIGRNSGIWGVQDDNILGRRMQDHMVVTADGDYQMLVNEGNNGALTMLTSVNTSASWRNSFSIADSDRRSTADIILTPDKNTLIVTYSNSSNEVVYEEYNYNISANTWGLSTKSVLASPLDPRTLNPTVAVSPAGKVVGFTEQVPLGLRIYMAISPNDGATWSTYDTVLAATTAGSSRTIATAGATGLLYTTSTAMMWVTYDAEYGWIQQQVLSSSTPGFYGSHFSAIGFGNNIYIATPDDSGNLIFISYDGTTKTWNPPVELGIEYPNVTNVQVSASDLGNLYITYDDAPHNILKVIKSKDGGATWVDEATLKFPVVAVDPVIRFAAPEYFTGNLVVMLQMQVIKGVNGLYQYVVDVNAASASGGDAIATTSVDVPQTYNDINGLYQQILNRPVEPGGLQTYTNLLNSGTSLAALQGILAHSPEAQADIDQLYGAVLGRPVDPSGLATYQTTLGGGDANADSLAADSLAKVRDIVAHSPEAQADLTLLFQEVTGRVPVAAEMVGMEDQLSTGASQAGLESALLSNGSTGGYTTVAAPSADATLSAQPGTATLFVFDDIGFGTDTIVGFDPSRDAIQLPHTLVGDYATLQNETLSLQDGSSMIVLNPSQAIVIDGVSPGALSPTNFHFA